MFGKGKNKTERCPACGLNTMKNKRCTNKRCNAVKNY